MFHFLNNKIVEFDGNNTVGRWEDIDQSVQLLLKANHNFVLRMELPDFSFKVAGAVTICLSWI